MKLQIMSDLHSEFWGNHDWLFAKEILHPDAKDIVLVVAGDLDSHIDGIERWFAWVFSKYKACVYVLGNHEYYGHSLRMIEGIKRTALRWPTIRVLENESCVVDGRCFVGATLWSNGWSAKQYSHGIADYSVITKDTFSLTVSDTCQMHKESCDFISQSPRDSIVVTHHIPDNRLIHPYYQKSQLNPFFSSNTGIKGFPLWVYGHTHLCDDRVLEGTRYICNPMGYIRTSETADFDTRMVIEV